jgi:hypothetical protein
MERVSVVELITVPSVTNGACLHKLPLVLSSPLAPYSSNPLTFSPALLVSSSSSKGPHPSSSSLPYAAPASTFYIYARITFTSISQNLVLDSLLVGHGGLWGMLAGSRHPRASGWRRRTRLYSSQAGVSMASRCVLLPSIVGSSCQV